MSTNLKIILISLIMAIITVAGFYFMFISNLSACGFSVGPIYPKQIVLIDYKLVPEQYIDLPEGKLGFVNLSDDLNPKIIKFNSNNEIEWISEFINDSSSEIPFQKLSEMELIHDENGTSLKFFNYSYSEPGRIYLNKDFQIEYMCLKAF